MKRKVIRMKNALNNLIEENLSIENTKKYKDNELFFCENFEEFINNRLSKPFYELEHSKRYKEYQENYSYIYSKLTKNLNNQQKNLLQELIKLESQKRYYYTHSSYKTGFLDGIYILDYLEEDIN